MAPTPYLQAWRLHNGFSQKELAERAGLTQAQVSYLENGAHLPTLRTLDKLARALHIGVGELMSLPQATQPLSRHDLDAIALAIVSGERNLRPEFNHLADRIASVISRKLNAFKARGRRVNLGKRWGGKFQWSQVRRMLPDPVLTQILSRVDKSLP